MSFTRSPMEKLSVMEEGGTNPTRVRIVCFALKVVDRFRVRPDRVEGTLSKAESARQVPVSPQELGLKPLGVFQVGGMVTYHQHSSPHPVLVSF